MKEFLIRKSVQADNAGIEALYPTAFPDENLVPLVQSLLRDEVIATSLVASIDDELVGHIILTSCGIEDGHAKGALLGPLVVAPSRQRQGVGSALVHAGLGYARESGDDFVCVLGDPGYYGRLGFAVESCIEPPFPLPPEWAGAWQSQRLARNAATRHGRLSVPPQWWNPALWSP